MCRSAGSWPSTGQATSWRQSPDLRLYTGAGDGNRTRTISLGIGQIMACDAIDQPTS